MKHNYYIIPVFLICLIGLSLSAKNVDEESIESSESVLSERNQYGSDPRIFEDDEQDPKTDDHPISTSKIITKQSIFKWSRSSLTYSIRNYPLQLNQSITKKIIRKAFKTWFDHIPLTIEEICSTCQSDFVIRFVSKADSDEYSFDGLGGMLSIAYLPEDGRILFDKDEIWTDGLDDDKTNLYSVAMHGIGHALGLSHTFRKDSVMYPIYQKISQDSMLTSFDRKLIQHLYGKKQSSTTISTSTRKIVTITKG